MISAALYAAWTSAIVLAASVLQNPMIVGLVVGIPASYFGYQAYQRTKKLDEVAALAAQANSQSAATQLVIDGYKNMTESLQADNKVQRQIAANLADQLAAALSKLDGVTAECRELRKRVDALDGNGA